MKSFLPATCILAVVTSTAGQIQDLNDRTSRFNRELLDGGRASENPASNCVEDGAIVGCGPCAHLF